MLNYEKNRIDYGSALMPPEGYILAQAIATTFSLDLETFISIPVALYYSKPLEGDTFNPDKFELLDGIAECSKKIKLFCQKGHIHVPRSHSNLFAYLEDAICEIIPSGLYNSFHPKLWVIKYEAEDKPAKYKLIILSKNLKVDRCWDIAVHLTGKVEQKEIGKNKPIVDFLEYLNKQSPINNLKSFCSELMNVKFEGIEKFKPKYIFHPIGISGYEKSPIQNLKNFNKLLIISPFLNSKGLTIIKKSVVDEGSIWLFSRKEELSNLKSNDLEGIIPYALSDLVVDGEMFDITEDGNANIQNQNLHAKLYIYTPQNSSSTKWFLGSANATSNGLGEIDDNRGNIEFLLELGVDGRSMSFNDILKELLGDDDNPLGVFEKFEVDEDTDEKEEKNSIDKIFDNLRYHLIQKDVIQSAKFNKNEDSKTFNMIIALNLKTIKIESDFNITLKPFNYLGDSANLSLGEEKTLEFTNLSLVQLSRFLEFEITFKKKEKKRFLIKLENLNIPDDRYDAILKEIISSSGKFFLYLRFLLLDADEILDVKANTDNLCNTQTDSNFINFDSPILEDLLKTSVLNPEKLKKINDLILRLQNKSNSKESIIPQKFLDLWEHFRIEFNLDTEKME